MIQKLVTSFCLTVGYLLAAGLIIGAVVLAAMAAIYVAGSIGGIILTIFVAAWVIVYLLIDQDFYG